MLETDCKNSRKHICAQGNRIQKRSGIMPHGNCGYVLIFGVLLLVSVEFKAVIVKLIFTSKHLTLSRFIQSILGSNF